MQASVVLEARDPSLTLSRVVALVAIALSLVHAAAAQTASGHFSSRTLDVPIAGSYSYWDRASGDKGRVLKVALSNAGFRASVLDDWHDRGTAIHELFASDEVKVVYFDFDPDGRYRGYSYYFASGDGCGWCYDSTVHSTVRNAHGHLSGSVAFDGGPGSVAFGP